MRNEGCLRGAHARLARTVAAGLQCALVALACQAGGTASPKNRVARIRVLETNTCPEVAGRALPTGTFRLGIRVELSGGSGMVVNPYYAHLVDREDTVHTAVLWGCEPQLPSVILQADERVQGWLTFEVSKDTTPQLLEYVLPQTPPMRIGLESRHEEANGPRTE